MMPAILNVPRTEPEWLRWAFHHRQQHDAIRRALSQQLDIQVPDQILEPIPLFEPAEFLRRNQQAHVDMNEALGYPSSDLSAVDLGDYGALQGWLLEEYQELLNASTRLGLP